MSQVLRASLVVHTHEMKDDLVRDLFNEFFCERLCPASFLSGTQFLQLVLLNSRAIWPFSYEMCVDPAFESQIYYHIADLITREARRKKLNTGRNALNNTLVGMVI